MKKLHFLNTSGTNCSVPLWCATLWNKVTDDSYYNQDHKIGVCKLDN